MTIKYAYWLSQQAARDNTLWQLALIALSLVAAWELLRWVPTGLATRLRNLYLTGGAALFVAGLVITQLTMENWK